MDNNPLAAITKGITDFVSSIESGKFENLNPQMAEQLKKMTPEEREAFMKQVKSDKGVMDGLKKIKKEMSNFKKMAQQNVNN